jgi:transcription antitermination factor NusG
MNFWYALYTNPRSEKRAHAELISKGIDSYLPLQRTLKQWSDRKKWVEEPLFRSYLFVYIPQNQYFEVLNTPGVVRYVTFEGKAVPIPPKQIEAIKYFLSGQETLQEKNNDSHLGNHPRAAERTHRHPGRLPRPEESPGRDRSTRAISEPQHRFAGYKTCLKMCIIQK